MRRTGNRDACTNVVSELFNKLDAWRRRHAASLPTLVNGAVTGRRSLDEPTQYVRLYIIVRSRAPDLFPTELMNSRQYLATRQTPLNGHVAARRQTLQLALEGFGIALHIAEMVLHTPDTLSPYDFVVEWHKMWSVS